jgi:phospholipid/cholesterol/gamma-HCH transport system substrate-binding protein
MAPTNTKKRLEIELKVGLFVSLGLALVMAAILVMGSADSIFSRRNHYVTHMPSAEGLINGAKVMLSGIQVGAVESMAFDGQRRDVAIRFTVDSKGAAWVRKDSSVEVMTQGVLGDKFLSVIPGTENAPKLANGDEVPVHPSKDLSQFINKGDQLLVSLNSIATDFNRILKGFESNNRSEIFFSNITATSKNLAEATDHLNQQIDQMPLKAAVKNLNAILEKINHGSGTLGALINDPALYDSAKALVGGANRNRIVRNLVRQAVQKGEASEDETAPAERSQK